MKYKIVQIHTEVFNESYSNSKKRAERTRKLWGKNSNDDVLIIKGNEEVILQVVKK